MAAYMHPVVGSLASHRWVCSHQRALLSPGHVQDAQMAHNLERLRHAAVDALVRTANAAPNKRLGNIFLIMNFTHICQVGHAG